MDKFANVKSTCTVVILIFTEVKNMS